MKAKGEPIEYDPLLEAAVEDELAFFHGDDSDEEEEADYVEKLPDFMEEPLDAGEVIEGDWETGLDFVPEYDETYGEDVAEEHAVASTKSSEIEVSRLVSSLGKCTDADAFKGDRLASAPCADFMLEVLWEAGGWEAPGIRRAADLRLHPSAAALADGAIASERLWVYQGPTGLQILQPEAALDSFKAKAVAARLPAQWATSSLLRCVEEVVVANRHAVPPAAQGVLLVQLLLLGSSPTAAGLSDVATASLIAMPRAVPLDSSWGVPEKLQDGLAGKAALDPAESEDVWPKWES